MVYFISGLGADERVFQFLNLATIDHRFIKWDVPSKGESLLNYSARLTEQIDQTSEVILIGISFGGIVAQEIAKLITCKKVIIISSIKATSEFSWQLKLARRLKFHRFVPLWLLALSNKLTADYFFGTNNQADSILPHQIIRDTDPKFLRWAMDQIMNWQSHDDAANIFHLHGTEDKIFPIKNIKNPIGIPNGGHFMIVNKSVQVQQHIFDLIKQP